MFKIGSRVSLKNNPKIKGKIKSTFKYGGDQIYELVFDDGTVRTKSEKEIIAEIINRNSWELLANDIFADPDEYIISGILNKIDNKVLNTISILKASRTIFKPYQYKPLMKFLNSDSKNLLIADEVGLGKTIEAGHILLESILRGDVKNCLIICKKSLIEKWKNELKEKFNIDFKTYEKVKDLNNELLDDAESRRNSLKAIINFEKIRSQEFQKIIEEYNYSFDMIIIDEAQTLRNSSTKVHKGAASIVENSNSTIMLSATPIMTSLDNLHSLIKLLEPHFEERSAFSWAIELNKPFIKAQNNINNGMPLGEVLTELKEEEVNKGYVYSDGRTEFTEEFTIKEYYKNDKLFKELELLLEGVMNPIKGAEIQSVLSEFNSFNNIYSRTRKRDVLDSNQRIIRKPHKIPIVLSEKEREIYDHVLYDYQLNDKSHLGLIQHKRMMSSSINVYYNSHQSELVQLHRPEEDSKFIELKKIINNVVKNKKKKIIVFSFFTTTLEYLDKKLIRKGYNTAVIHGKRKNRFEEIERFKNDKDVNILLSSEVGSEGLDLQFCDSLVNYDLPWNPMVVEQRIGRIDRIGQNAEKINIYNLIVKDSIEEDIYDRLLDRINLFKESIGDLEVILQEDESDLVKKLKELETNLFTTKQTREERRKIIQQAEQAIETERITLKKLEVELKESFVNDAHLNSEISKIESEDRYVTEQDIYNICNYLFKKIIPNVKFTETSDKYIYKISWRKNESNTLFSFIDSNLSKFHKQPELHTILKDFRKKYLTVDHILVTFNQKISFENRKIEFINAYHPIIDSFKNYCTSNNIGLNQNFSFEIPVNKINIEPGYYLLCTYNLKVDKLNLYGKETFYTIQNHILFDINGEEIVEVDQEKVNSLVKISQTNSFNTSLDFNFSGAPELIDLLRSSYLGRAYSSRLSYTESESLLFTSEMERKYKMEEEIIDINISRFENYLSNSNSENIRKMEYIWNSKIEKLKEKKDNLFKQKSKMHIHIEDELISTTMVKIV